MKQADALLDDWSDDEDLLQEVNQEPGHEYEQEPGQEVEQEPGQEVEQDLKEYIVTAVPKKPIEGQLLSGFSIKCNFPDFTFGGGRTHCKHCIYIMIKKVFI